MLLPALETLLRERLAGPLPGGAAHVLMAPRPRTGWMPGHVPADARRGAGLVLLFPGLTGATVVLTLRPATLAQHAGQVSLPGGAAEPGEELAAAALREAHEELGVEPGNVRILGPLSPLHIPVSGFALHPFVGATDARPAWVRDAREVERVLEVGVDELGDPARLYLERRPLGDILRQVPCISVADQPLWGATAMILAELLWLIGRPPSPAWD